MMLFVISGRKMLSNVAEYCMRLTVFFMVKIKLKKARNALRTEILGVKSEISISLY